jgi:hypothetical protein
MIRWVLKILGAGTGADINNKVRQELIKIGRLRNTVFKIWNRPKMEKMLIKAL